MRSRSAARGGALWLALLLLPCAAKPEGRGRTVAGVVLSGRNPVSDARVSVAGGRARASARTGSDGRFRFPGQPAAPLELSVEAKGFVAARQTIPAGAADLELTVALLPAAFSETVTVAAARTEMRLADSAASVAVLSSAEIAAGAAPALDEAIRQVPGFSLFRRSDSRTANPTTQGVFLRGIGGSGGSRAAVFDDGVPLNDPFGGWIFWGRVPRESLERVEVLRGGASDLYGGAALAGAVQLVRREPSDPTLLAESSFGSRETPEASLFASAGRGAWGACLAAETFRTAGYVPVGQEQRGPVDRAASSRHDTLDVTLERKAPAGPRLFLRGSSFDESRENGTALQRNDARIGQLAAGLDWPGSSVATSVRVYGLEERYHQTFSSISPDRASESLTRVQTVPSRAVGLSAQGSKALGSHVAIAGVEARQVSGSSDEDVFGGAAVTFAGVSGRQRQGAFFLEDVWSASARWLLTAGLRWDAWRNFEAERRSGPSAARAAAEKLPDRSEDAVSPRASVLYRIRDDVSLTASAYRSFRAPTLNELYRSFRVGNVVTLANDNLAAERLSGGEVGAILSNVHGASARATLFWMEIDGAISNVTLATTPSVITRQRQNLGRTRSRGVELDAEWRVASGLSLSAGYLFADATVESFPANPALEGQRVPQVPRHQGSLRARYARSGGGMAALSARWLGDQFEDDQNALRLGGYWTFDALVAFPVFRNLELFAACENLLDRRFDLSRTPVLSVGPPRALRAGLRLRLGGD